MTQDSSANFIETERFLERRLEGGRAVETAVGNVGEWAGGTAWGVLNSLRSKGVRI